MRTSRVVVLASLLAAQPAAANTCLFLSGGTLHEQTPLGCPIEIYHASDDVFSARPHAETITVLRNGAPVELTVLSSMAVRSREVPVRFDRPSATCDYEFYTEPREVDGFAIEVEGLEVGDQFGETVIVDAAPCPTLILDYSSIDWLQCSPPIQEYDLCCERLGPDCGRVPPDDSGCRTMSLPSSSASLGVALVLLALRKRKRRTT